MVNPTLTVLDSTMQVELERPSRKVNFPARLIGVSSSESSKVKLQSELNQARQVDCVGHHAKVGTGESPVRRSELRMIKQVEELRPELNVKSLGDGGSLDHCEIEIDDSLLPNRSVYSRFIAEDPFVVRPSCRSIGPARLSEAGCVEPLRDP